jgi:hypothetical protein
VPRAPLAGRGRDDGRDQGRAGELTGVGEDDDVSGVGQSGAAGCAEESGGAWGRLTRSRSFIQDRTVKKFMCWKAPDPRVLSRQSPNVLLRKSKIGT